MIGFYRTASGAWLGMRRVEDIMLTFAKAVLGKPGLAPNAAVTAAKDANGASAELNLGKVCAALVEMLCNNVPQALEFKLWEETWSKQSGGETCLAGVKPAVETLLGRMYPSASMHAVQSLRDMPFYAHDPEDLGHTPSNGKEWDSKTDPKPATLAAYRHKYRKEMYTTCRKDQDGMCAPEVHAHAWCPQTLAAMRPGRWRWETHTPKRYQNGTKTVLPLLRCPSSALFATTLPPLPLGAVCLPRVWSLPSSAQQHRRLVSDFNLPSYPVPLPRSLTPLPYPAPLPRSLANPLNLCVFTPTALWSYGMYLQWIYIYL